MLNTSEENGVVCNILRNSIKDLKGVENEKILYDLQKRIKYY